MAIRAQSTKCMAGNLKQMQWTMAGCERIELREEHDEEQKPEAAYAASGDDAEECETPA
ncbi:MAG: hypothetical protein K2Y13_14845 [Burkholderiaceae bacterium]|nr:hypothetical protein [Burkholderiaceae bacterium]